MATKLDQLARVVWLAWNKCHDAPVPVHVIFRYENDERIRADCLIVARAVVEKLREPTEGMLADGTIGWQANDGSPIRPVFSPLPSWQKMIDFILNEKPE